MPETWTRPVRTVVLATDAGHAGSVLTAIQLARLLPDGVRVLHHSVDSLPAGADVVVAHTRLAQRITAAGTGHRVVGYDRPVGDPALDDLAAAIVESWTTG